MEAPKDIFAAQSSLADYAAATERAVVLFSGGQDSTTVLHYALQRHGPDNVIALGFRYGQQHSVELEVAAELAQLRDVPYETVEMPQYGSLVDSALTTVGGDVGKPHDRLKDLPASFVPGRNALFLTMGHAFADALGADIVYGGMCQTDYSGYPDCRAIFVQALETALSLGYQSHVRFITPLMHLTKADTWDLAHYMGAAAFQDVKYSHTCYKGNREVEHGWGYGCGECPACKLRADGWADFIFRGRI